MRFLLTLVLISFLSVSAQTFNLEAGASISDAITNAENGDAIVLAAGTYEGGFNFAGKAISITGAGKSTVIEGNDSTVTVTFNAGELNTSVLRSVRLKAARGNEAIRIEDSSPIIENCFIDRNRSNSGASGIYLLGEAQSEVAIIRNNVLALNRALNRANDPHQINILDASPRVENNTIFRGDSNGIFIRGNSSPLVVNNIIAFNGSRGRGRGICLISLADGANPDIQYNLFFRNRIGDILAGSDFKNIKDAEDSVSGLSDNLHANPRFRRSKKARNLTLRNNSPAIDAGNPAASFDDTDNSPNDIGYTGGQNSDFALITLF